MKKRRTKRDLVERCGELGREYSALSVAFRTALAKRAGLSALDMECLDYIAQRGSACAGDLVASSGLSSGAVTGLIRRLEARDYIKCVEDETDRRKTIVVPNTGELRDIARIYGGFGSRSAAFLASFTEAEVLAIGRFFEGMSSIYREEIAGLEGRNAFLVPRTL